MDREKILESIMEGWMLKRGCPIFSGRPEEYKSWRSKVDDWLKVAGKQFEYPGIEIRLSLKGKAEEITENIDREKLCETNGEKMILKILDESYLKDRLTDKYHKMKSYFKIKRETGEKMRDYLARYEKMEMDCKKAMGKNLFDEEAKGLHVLEQANLTETQEQMVLASCADGNLEYGKVSAILKRTFEAVGSNEESQWLGAEGRGSMGPGRDRESYGSNEESQWWRAEGSGNVGLGRGRESYGGSRGRWNTGRGGRNPVNREGKITQCALCKSEWHWVRDCPQNFRNRNREELNFKGKSKEERNAESHVENMHFGGVNRIEEKNWGEVDVILDTGCKSTVCGEL